MDPVFLNNKAKEDFRTPNALRRNSLYTRSVWSAKVLFRFVIRYL